MRKILSILFISAAGIASAQFGNLENGRLENWANVDTLETLQSWFWNATDAPGIAVKTTDAQNQTYAVKLSTVDIDGTPSPGLLALGDFSQGLSGIPYSAQIDSVVFWTKYNVMPGDSASIIVIQFQGGNFLPTIITIGGTQATYARKAYKLLSPFQDSLAIIVSSGDLFGGTNSIVGSTITVDNFSCKGFVAGPALPNQSLENYNQEIVVNPVAFQTPNGVSQGFGFGKTVTKVTDVQEGQFAAKLQAVGAGQGNIPGIISNSIDANFNQTNGVPYTQQPDSLTGWYKYTATANDQGFVTVDFYNNGNVVANAFFPMTANVSTYTKFVMPFTFSGVPDSMAFTAYSGDATTSILFLDNLNFHGNNVGLDENFVISTNVYPNPATDYVTITANAKINTVKVYALDGTLVKTANGTSNLSLMNVSDLNAGTYFIEVTSGKNVAQTKFVVR